MEYCDYIGNLITAAREDTGEDLDIPTSSNLVGIPNASFLRYANMAQYKLQGLIIKQRGAAFLARKEISAVADTREYTINDNLFQGTRIFKVEYSPNSLESGYYKLHPGNPYNSIRNTGRPSIYHRFNDKIVVEPQPSLTEGLIKVTYQRTLDKLALRAGTVDAATLSATQLTALSLDIATDTGFETALEAARSICIHAADGTVKMYNVPVTAYSTASGNFTLAAFTFAEDETAAIGDYVTIGKYTTTHSKLPVNAEMYLTEFMNKRVLIRTSSSDNEDVDQNFKELEGVIVSNFKVPDEDLHEFPRGEFEDDFLNYGGNYDSY